MAINPQIASRANPLEQFPIFQSSDIEEAHDLIAKNFSRHSLSILSAQQSLETRYDGLFFNDMALFCGTYGADVIINPESSQYFFTQTTLTGNTSVVMGDEQVHTRSGGSVVVSPSASYQMTLHRGSSRLITMFKRQALENHLSQLLNRPLDQPLVFDLNMEERSDAGSAWQRSLLFLCEQFSSSEFMLNSEAFRKQASDLLMTQLLNSQAHNYSTQLHQDPVVNSPRHVRRAVAYIEEHIHEPISLADLAESVGVTSRTLQKGFLKYTGSSPSEYIRNLRIACVHEQLQRACGDVQVSEILLNYGITSFGHFAKAYKAVHGCTPAETLHR